jgi:hypothetical protein
MSPERVVLRAERLARKESLALRSREWRSRNEKPHDGLSERDALTGQRVIGFADSDGRSSERGVRKRERLCRDSERLCEISERDGRSSGRVGLPSESAGRTSATTGLSIAIVFLTTERIVRPSWRAFRSRSSDVLRTSWMPERFQ